jgi:hypothetical protein
MSSTALNLLEKKLTPPGAKRRDTAWPDPERTRKLGDLLLGAVFVLTCLSGLAMILVGVWQD